MKNYYKILGLKMSASDAEIKQAYRGLAKTLHPDINKNNPQAETALLELNEAYEVLSDPAKRTDYNAQLNAVIAQQKMNTQPPPQYSYNARGAQSGSYNAKSAYAAQSAAAHAAAQAMQMQQMQAQAAFENAVNKAYNDGYTKGALDKQAAIDPDIKKLNFEIKELRDKLRRQERETEEADSEVEELAAKVKALKDDNKRLTQHAKEMAKSDKEKEYIKLQEKSELELGVANTHLERAKEKLKEAESESFRKDSEIETLKEEVIALSNRLKDLEEYAESMDAEKNIEKSIIERSAKMKAERKSMKDTCYGALGVTFWATDDEIKENYEKLKKRFKTKADSGDANSIKRLDNIEKAYTVLSDKSAKESYNAGLNITEEDILKERSEEEEYNKMIEAYEAQKDEEEFWAYVDDLIIMSDAGDTEAQNTLGEMYYYGDEIEKDLSQAFYWFREAAKHNHAAAMYNMGVCFYNGEGTDKDIRKGTSFIRQARKLGVPEADKFIKEHNL